MTSILIKNNGLDKISSTDVRRKYTEMARIVRSNNKPVEITVNGKADLVMMNPELFESWMELIEDYEDEIAILRFKSNNSNSFISSDELLKDVEVEDFKDMSIDDLLSQ